MARSCVGRDTASGAMVTRNVSELVRGRHEDEREMDFVRVEGKVGNGDASFALKTRGHSLDENCLQ